MEDVNYVSPAASVQHPYYPPDLVLEGQYVERVSSLVYIIGGYFLSVGLISLITFFWSGTVKHFNSVERYLVCWFAWTAATHIILEGAFVIDDKFYENQNEFNVLAETWKEYAKADARYASRDKSVLFVEIAAAFFEGPLLALAIFGMAAKSSWRHFVIVVASLCQLYGVVLYYYTVFTDKIVYYRPEPLYFYFYLIFMNGIWVVVPLFCILYSGHELCRATATLDKSKDGNGKKQQ
eukprot:TRINITY_DN20364_c0_g1_i5.p2 TRINITY_DN20364_c0_g1~~TRINITY_DN20364_c0_g1_i5.p2  ORF type:complete len:237 (-),score=13.81 TRINITY_DN20364_c0_g1_i5:511-1221(-)